MKSDIDSIKYWASKFPYGFKEFVNGLSNEKRMAIANLLLYNNELRFSEIQKELKLKKNVLSQHLKKMQKLGLIRRTKTIYDEGEETVKSHYKLNPKYSKLIKNNIDQLSQPLIKRHRAGLIQTSSYHPKEEIEIVSIGVDRKSQTWEANFVYRQKWSKPKNIGGEIKWIKAIRKN